MATATRNQWSILKIDQDTHLLTWIEAFLVDRKAQGFSPNTVKYYQNKLALFSNYCESQLITHITQITPNNIRAYMLYLEAKGHNPGGRHGCYRSVKTFLYWWEEEVEPEGWSNPIRKAKPPKLVVEQLTPVKLEDIKAMIETCDKSPVGLRDRAILLSLLDTGARAQELIDMTIDDLNLVTGEISIRLGKGGKFRTVFLGRISRRAVRAYLKSRSDNCDKLWITLYGEPLAYWGLREIIRRRAAAAKVKTPSIHSFRRAFALNMLRAGVDIFSLQKLMGHADLQVLRRYLAQTTDDIAQAHKKGSPVDNNKF